MYQKRSQWIRCVLLASTIIVSAATSTVAQPEAGGFGAAGMGGGGGMAVIQLPALPSQGILAVRNSIRVGGVTISEARGMAVVLSANPLVLVTGKELLQVGEEYPDEIPGAVNSVICSYAVPVVGMGGGMAGGVGMGSSGLSVSRSDFVLEPQPLIVRDGESDLLFIFATAKVDQNFFSTARLVKNPQTTEDWPKWVWLEGEHPETLKEDGSASPIATVAPDGSVALIVDGKIYALEAIMKEYLQVYNSQVRDRVPFHNDSSALPLTPPGGFGGAAAFGSQIYGSSGPARPSESSFPDRRSVRGTYYSSPVAQLPMPASGQSQPLNAPQGRLFEAPNPRSDRIINAVLEAKTAADETQAAKARSQLKELLEIEFDAQRTQKATELETLRQRIQQIEKAEEELKTQRDQTIEHRLQRLLSKPAG